MQISDVLSLSYRTIKGNKLRTGITVAIIAFGIMALVGIFTAIDAMNQKFRESFASMGANSFSIRYQARNIHRGGMNNSEVKKQKRGLKEKKSNQGKFITYDEVRQFKERFTFPAKVGIAYPAGNSRQIIYKDTKTDPDVRLMGGDENYLDLNGYNIMAGRDINKMDVESGRNVLILGYDVAKKLFPNAPEKAVDKIVNMSGIKYRIIGVMEAKGTVGFFSADRVAITTYNNIRLLYGTSTSSYSIGIKISDISKVEAATQEATATFRPIRKLAVTEENNFNIEKSDAFAETMISGLSSISGAAGIIGFITLLGAAIGLMNIMLVAVAERTKEVGLVKAVGARKNDIKMQFLFESILISLLGAAIGIILGIFWGNVFSYVLNTGFVIPWGWIIGGIVICSVVGLVAGIYPAIKASRLDPIVALRYE
jgi:putative ABC transport system permease protein